MRTVLRKSWLVGLLLCWALAGNKPLDAQEGRPMSLDAILKLKAAEIDENDIAGLVEKRGVDFEFTAEVAEKLIAGGCGVDLVKKIRAVSKQAQATPATGEKLERKDPPKNDGIRQPGNDDTGLMPALEEEDDPLPPAIQKPGLDGDDPLPETKPGVDGDDPLPLPSAKPPANKPAVAPKPQPANPFKRADPADGLDKTTEAAPEMFYGPRAADEKQTAVEQRFKDILKTSGLQLQITASKHITLIASAANAQKFLPDMKLLEQKLEQRFPGTIKTGPDKRSAILVLVDTQDDYKKWITAEYTSFGLDKAPAEGQGGANPLLMALNARGSFFPFVGVNDLSAAGNDQDRKKAVAYAVGYLYMHALTESHAPDCFITGFGNYCEALMYTNPMTRVYSYEERQIANGPQVTWVNQMKDGIQQKKASSSDDVIGFSTVTMKSVNYVEAWSLISFLAARPREFESLVNALRDKNGTMKAVQALYRYDSKNLDYYWKAWANTQN